MDVFIIFMVNLPDQTFSSMRARTRSDWRTAVSPQPRTYTGCSLTIDQGNECKALGQAFIGEKHMIGKKWILANGYALDG